MSFHIFTAVAVSARLLPHTYLVDRLKKYRSTYSFDDKEIPVSKVLQQRFKEVMDDLNLAEDIRQRIQLFRVHDVKIYNAGITYTKYGAIIGIPPTYEYNHPEELDMDKVHIQQKVQWSNDKSAQFFDSLVLSENAQKFAMAREILRVQQEVRLLKPINVGLDCYLTLSLYKLSNKVFNTSNKPKQYKILLQTFHIVFGFILWMVSENLMDYTTEIEIREQLIKLGPNYIQGGKEFYEKLCQFESVMLSHMTEHERNFIKNTYIRRVELPAEEQLEFYSVQEASL